MFIIEIILVLAFLMLPLFVIMQTISSDYLKIFLMGLWFILSMSSVAFTWFGDYDSIGEFISLLFSNLLWVITS